MFKKIKGYPNYSINENGDVKRYGRILKQRKIGGSSYFYVSLSKKSIVKNFYIHRLVLLTFVGKPTKGHECAHLDGNKFNNHISNLKWVTRKENFSHKKLHGTEIFGSRNGNCKYGTKIIEKIKRDFSDGASNSALGKKYGLRRRYVWEITSGIARVNG